MTRKLEVRAKSDQELVRLYERAALDHHQASDRGDPKAANQAADFVAAIYRELRQRG